VKNEADEKPGMISTEIDLDEVDRIRAQLPLLSARRTDVYDVREI
jgi:predicted amidohydrolase